MALKVNDKGYESGVVFKFTDLQNSSGLFFSVSFIRNVFSFVNICSKSEML
jgi:hypothetical protein